MAAAATITSALSLHATLRTMFDSEPNEDTSDVFFAAATEALDQAIAIPASSISEVRSKLAALIEDADCDWVEIDRLDFIMRDLTALAGRSVQ